MPLWQKNKKRNQADSVEASGSGRPYDEFVYDDMQDQTGAPRSFAFDDMLMKPGKENSPFLDDMDISHSTAGKPAASFAADPEKEPEEWKEEEQPEEEPEEKRSAGPTAGLRTIVVKAEQEEETDDFGYPVEEEFETPERSLAELQREREELESGRGSSLVKKMKERRGVGKEKKRDEGRPARKDRKTPLGLRKFGTAVITILITLVLGFMFFSNIETEGAVGSLLAAPETGVAAIVTPVQTMFSGLTEAIAGYIRTLKLRSAIEAEYNALRAENETLVYQAMLADELQIRLQQYENLNDEVQANTDMNPLTCRVIGRDETNYFSTFTINKGKRDGVEDYMAVTLSGALVGYTENVQETSATVRTVIDSEASIAALIQSSRDQGIVSGTLGIDGTHLCRMYYLSEENLPRPGDLVVTSGVGMSFPKGIPIGTVRESTRGMESNKQYIVLEPKVDLEHIEYVIVLRYQPLAEAVTGRTTAKDYNSFVPLETARPYPTLRIGGTNMFAAATPIPNDLDEEAPTPEVVVTATPSPVPTATPEPTVTPVPTETPEVFEYRSINDTPTPSPSPSPTPSPTPYVTLHPDAMTYEED